MLDDLMHACQGTIRRATRDDAPALSRLMACVGTDLLPLTTADLDTQLGRGHVFVLDFGSGTLGAAAHVAVDHIGRARFRYVAVDPALARTGIEKRMTAAMFDLDARTRAFSNLRVGLTRRAHSLMISLLLLPRVIISAGTDAPIVAMFVWSTLALLFATTTPRIPKAIARCSRVARL